MRCLQDIKKITSHRVGVLQEVRVDLTSPVNLLNIYGELECKIRTLINCHHSVAYRNIVQMPRMLKQG